MQFRKKANKVAPRDQCDDFVKKMMLDAAFRKMDAQKLSESKVIKEQKELDRIRKESKDERRKSVKSFEMVRKIKKKKTNSPKHDEIHKYSES